MPANCGVALLSLIANATISAPLDVFGIALAANVNGPLAMITEPGEVIVTVGATTETVNETVCVEVLPLSSIAMTVRV